MLKNVRQVGLLDSFEFIGKASVWIDISPLQIANKFGYLTERVFDDFDLYEFIGLKVDDKILCFRNYSRNGSNYSYVSFSDDVYDIDSTLKELFGEGVSIQHKDELY